MASAPVIMAPSPLTWIIWCVSVGRVALMYAFPLALSMKYALRPEAMRASTDSASAKSSPAELPAEGALARTDSPARTFAGMLWITKV